MRKIIAMVLCLGMILSMVACGGSTASTDPVGNAGNTSEKEAGKEDSNVLVEVSDEVLEMLGMSREEFAAMDPDKQKALADEMGAVLTQTEKKEETKPASQTYTPGDVMAGGSYKVVLGDYMNSITLYYENGKLVKLVEEFQKNSAEEAYGDTYEGDALAEYTFNFIDWDGASLQDILDGMKDYGNYGEYRIQKTE